MDTIDALIFSSPAQAEHMVIGVVAGAIIMTALVSVSMLRQLALIVVAVAVVAEVILHGLNGLVSTADAIVHDARAHETMVKGLLAGKLLAGLWLRLQYGSATQRRRHAGGSHR